MTNVEIILIFSREYSELWTLDDDVIGHINNFQHIFMS